MRALLQGVRVTKLHTTLCFEVLDYNLYLRLSLDLTKAATETRLTSSEEKIEQSICGKNTNSVLCSWKPGYLKSGHIYSNKRTFFLLHMLVSPYYYILVLHVYVTHLVVYLYILNYYYVDYM